MARGGLGNLLRFISLMLSVVLLAGCTTQRVEFTSYPAGVEVIAGKKRGETPCVLKVSEDVESATFRHPSGEEKILPMPAYDSDLEEVGEQAGKVTGGILMVTGGVIAGAGFGLFMLGLWSLDDEDQEWYEDESGIEDDSDEWAIVGIGAAGMLGGLGLFGLGKWIYPDNDAPVLHAVFADPADEFPPKEEDRYEERGYGARRLKKATP